jgi:DNA-binding SARP family transcriptional activator
MTIGSDMRGGDRAQLSLFGGFALRIHAQKISLPMHARRVLAYLSLNKMVDKDCDRQVLAERLWMDSSPDRSRASLRTAIWRIRSAADDLILGDSERVALADSVRVDVHDFRRHAEQMLSDSATYEPPGLVPHLRSPADLLPGWDEDWLLLTREQLRLLRLHALEHTARRMCELGLYPQAIDAFLKSLCSIRNVPVSPPFITD